MDGFTRNLNSLCSIRLGQTIVADVRGCVNASPNTAAAASYAVECGATAVLMTALYHDKDEDEKPTIFLLSPYIEEYRCLSEMTYEKWFTGPHKASQIAVPDGLPDLALVSGLDEIWLDFMNPPDQLPAAWALATKCLPSSIEVKLFSGSNDVAYPDGATGADPRGKLGRKLITRPSNLLSDMALGGNPGPIQPNTFSVDGHPCAEILLVPIP